MGPKTIKMDWKVKPVPKHVEEKVGNYVVRRGEFGWLEDKRMDQIANFVKDLQMTLDQGLSLDQQFCRKSPFFFS